MSALWSFLRFLLPLVAEPVAREVVKGAKAYVQANPHFGPVPPDIEAWRADDRAVDAELARRRAMLTDPGDT